MVRIKLFKFKQKPPVYRELNNVIRIKKTQVWGPLFSCLFVVCCLMLTQYSSHVWIGFKQRMVSNEIYHEQHSCIYVLILSFIKTLKLVQWNNSLKNACTPFQEMNYFTSVKHWIKSLEHKQVLISIWKSDKATINTKATLA